MIVESVNVGAIADVPWRPRGTSAIDKRPVADRVWARVLGLAGDQIADLEHHGGPDKAVYAFAREELDFWSAELGRPLRAGQFGENLTTRGIAVDDARIGDRWRIGQTVLEVAATRIPCWKFQGFLQEKGWIKRFTEHGRPGAYLRVIVEGTIGAGDEIEVIETRSHDLTVARTFRALTTEQHLLPELAAEPRMGASIKRRLAQLADRAADRS